MATSQNQSGNTVSNQSGITNESSTQQQNRNTNTQQTQSQTTNQWLAQMPGASAFVQRLLNEQANTQMPQYQRQALSQGGYQDLQTIQNGRNFSGINQQLGQMAQQGQYLTNFNQQGNDINALTGQLFNSGTVNSQIGEMTNDVNKQLGRDVNTLNQQAIGSGNMASSRAGLAEADVRNNAARNIATGSAQIRNAEMARAEAAAQNQLQYGLTNAGTNLQNQIAGAYQVQTGLMQDAQGGYNSQLQVQNQGQQALDVGRQNQMLNNMSGLAVGQQYAPLLNQYGNWSVNQSGTMQGNEAATGNVIGSGSTISNGTGTTTSNQSGSQSGDSSGSGWGQMLSGIGGQVAGSALGAITGNVLGSGSGWSSFWS